LRVFVETIKRVWKDKHPLEPASDGLLGVVAKSKDDPISPIAFSFHNLGGYLPRKNFCKGLIVIKNILMHLESPVRYEDPAQITGIQFLLFAYEEIKINYNSINWFWKNSKFEHYIKNGSTVSLYDLKECKELYDGYDDNLKKIIEFMILLSFKSYQDQIKRKKCAPKSNKTIEGENEFRGEYAKVVQLALKSVKEDLATKSDQSVINQELNMYSELLEEIFTHNINFFCNNIKAFTFSDDEMVELLKVQFMDLEGIAIGNNSYVYPSQDEEMAIQKRQAEAIKLFDENEDFRKSSSWGKDVALWMKNVEAKNKPDTSEIIDHDNIMLDYKYANIGLKIAKDRSLFVYNLDDLENSNFIRLNHLQINIFYIMRAWLSLFKSEEKMTSRVNALFKLTSPIVKDLNVLRNYFDENNFELDMQEDQSIMNKSKSPNMQSTDQKAVEDSKVQLNAKKVILNAYAVMKRCLARIWKIGTIIQSGKSTEIRTYFPPDKIEPKPQDRVFNGIWNMISKRITRNIPLSKEFQRDFNHLVENVTTPPYWGKKFDGSEKNESYREYLENLIERSNYNNWKCFYVVVMFFYGYNEPEDKRFRYIKYFDGFLFLRNLECFYNQHANFYKQVDNLIEATKYDGMIHAWLDKFESVFNLNAIMIFLEKCYNPKTLKGDCSIEKYKNFLTIFYFNADQINYRKRVWNKQDDNSAVIPIYPSTVPFEKKFLLTTESVARAWFFF
jgi:hypothetical protein